MIIRLKNSISQSCRFCPTGGSRYKAEKGGDIFYICEDHRLELYPEIPIAPTREPEPAPVI